MNLNPCKIRRLTIKSFLNRHCLWHCCRCCLNCFFWFYLGSKHLPALSTICLFGCTACVWEFVCFALVCLNISLPFIQLLLFVQEHPSLIKLLFKFQNVLRHTKSQNSLACNPNIKEDIPTALEVFYCFETKQKDINRSSTKTSMQRASNIPGRTGCNVQKSPKRDHPGYKAYMGDSLSYLDDLLVRLYKCPKDFCPRM